MPPHSRAFRRDSNRAIRWPKRLIRLDPVALSSHPREPQRRDNEERAEERENGQRRRRKAKTVHVTRAPGTDARG
jgi:hypothetical protein